MKTVNLVIAFLLFSVLSFGQQGDFGPRHTVSAQYGYGWFGLFNDTEGDIEIDVNESGDPTIFTATLDGSGATTLAYDYRFGRVFSLGGAVGHQAIGFTGFRNTETSESISGSIDINRIFISGRTLFHYGKNPKWDLYSGVRVGATLWNVKSSVDQDEFTLETGITLTSGTLVLPHFVPIPFGFKYYPDSRFMLGAELAAGSPHVLALQAGLRF